MEKAIKILKNLKREDRKVVIDILSFDNLYFEDLGNELILGVESKEDEKAFLVNIDLDSYSVYYSIGYEAVYDVSRVTFKRELEKIR